MGKQDLYKETREAMESIYGQWGDVRTPFGHIWQVKQAWGWSSPITFGYEGVCIRADRWSEGYSSEDSMDAILKLADQTLPAMANYLASEDFTEKVQGSIRRLKAITKAIRGE